MSFAGNLLLRATGPRAVKRFDNLSRAPAQSQQRLLREILGTNADTEFGRRHGFAAIATFRDYQERVPICGYGDLEPYITAEMLGQPNQLTRHPPVLFTTTSGTTGASKYIPMTSEGKKARSSAVSPPSIRARSSCWPTGSHTTPKRSSATCATGRCRPTWRSHPSCGR